MLMLFVDAKVLLFSIGYFFKKSVLGVNYADTLKAYIRSSICKEIGFFFTKQRVLKCNAELCIAHDDGGANRHWKNTHSLCLTPCHFWAFPILKYEPAGQ
jgi:hypothetical protein